MRHFVWKPVWLNIGDFLLAEVQSLVGGPKKSTVAGDEKKKLLNKCWEHMSTFKTDPHLGDKALAAMSLAEDCIKKTNYFMATAKCL